MPLIPNDDAVFGFSSTFTFTKATFSEFSSANASIVGASALHGPHHGAQKSTSTGFPDFNTSCSNELSVTSLTNLLILEPPMISKFQPSGKN
jgi:hypothetical protein